VRRLLNGGAARQIVLIIVLAVVAAHAFSTAIWLSFDMRPGPPPEIRSAAAQIGLIRNLLMNAPNQDHAAVIAAAAKVGISVTEGADPPPVVVASSEFPALDLQRAAAEELGVQTNDVTAGVLTSIDHFRADLVVLLRDRPSRTAWILFQIHNPFPRRSHPRLWFSPGGLASFATVVLLIGFSSLWATRKVTTPLVRLARATESMDILQDPSPVAEEGTREVKQVAHAFNAVLERLRSVVADRTQMLASVSHDLRTPLTRLRLRAEAVEDADIQRKMLNDIRRMEVMLVATLAFLREEAAQEPIERIDIAVMVQTICDEFNDAGTEVHYEGPLHGAASCRPLALQRALINLIDNAARFETRVTVHLQVDADGIALAVEDDGPGIPDDQKETVFKPFYRGDASRGDQSGHMGLGLSIVEAVVQSHKGQIKLLDREPHGLCVQLKLPFLK
jgi:signal transduction histidine kinase